jgi:cysteine desulfurase
VPYLVGLGRACVLAATDLERYGQDVAAVRDLLEQTPEREAGMVRNGPKEQRLPNTANLCFPDVTGQDLFAATPGVAASTGSACHAGEVRLSPVLEAIGVAPELGRGAVRLSLGRFTAREEVEEAARRLLAGWRAARRA